MVPLNSNAESDNPSKSVGVVSSIVQRPADDARLNGITVDRFKVCPFLVKVFYSFGRHHDLMEYRRNIFPKNECHFFAWMDTTLSEIIFNIKEEKEMFKESSMLFLLQIISPDMVSPRYKARDIGKVILNKPGPDDNKTLQHCRFAIGDYIDICVKKIKV